MSLQHVSQRKTFNRHRLGSRTRIIIYIYIYKLIPVAILAQSLLNCSAGVLYNTFTPIHDEHRRRSVCHGLCRTMCQMAHQEHWNNALVLSIRCQLHRNCEFTISDASEILCRSSLVSMVDISHSVAVIVVEICCMLTVRGIPAHVRGLSHH